MICAHIAHDQLREAVITMRALRGQRVMPVVNLSEKPMSSQFGMRKRPAFAIVVVGSPRAGRRRQRGPAAEANAADCRPDKGAGDRGKAGGSSAVPAQAEAPD